MQSFSTNPFIQLAQRFVTRTPALFVGVQILLALAGILTGACYIADYWFHLAQVAVPGWVEFLASRDAAVSSFASAFTLQFTVPDASPGVGTPPQLTATELLLRQINQEVQQLKTRLPVPASATPVGAPQETVEPSPAGV